MPKSKTITACACGSTKFGTIESIGRDATLDKNGALILHRKNEDAEISYIECAQCGKEYGDLDVFKQISII